MTEQERKLFELDRFLHFTASQQQRAVGNDQEASRRANLCNDADRVVQGQGDQAAHVERYERRLREGFLSAAKAGLLP